jgi:hypothetical protein
MSERFLFFRPLISQKFQGEAVRRNSRERAETLTMPARFAIEMDFRISLEEEKKRAETFLDRSEEAFRYQPKSTFSINPDGCVLKTRSGAKRLKDFLLLHPLCSLKSVFSWTKVELIVKELRLSNAPFAELSSYLIRPEACHGYFLINLR